MSLFNAQVGFSADQTSLAKLRKDLDTVVSRGDKGYIKLSVDITEGERNLKKLQDEMKKIQKTGNKDQLAKITIDVSQAQAKLKDLQQVMGETDKRLGGMKQGFSELGNIIKNAIGITAIIEFGKRVFSLTSQVQQLKNAFTVLLGSEEKAVALLAEIDGFAKSTPFNKLQIAENAQKLLAFGFNGKQVIPILQAAGNAVAGLGGSPEKLDRVLLAIGQIQTKGKLMGQEMMQLTEAGIGGWDLLSKKLGKSSAELQKMGENGQLLAKDVIPALLSAMNDRFNGLMEKQSQTLAGRLSNLQDSFEQTLAKFGTSMSDFFGAGIDLAANFVDEVLPRFFYLFSMIKEGWSDIFGFIESIYSSITQISADMTGEQVDQNATMLQKIGTLWDFFLSALLAGWTGFWGTIMDYLFQAYDSIANNTLSLSDVMKSAFIGAGSAVMNSIIGVMNFVISKIESVVNTGISGLNSLIALANKVPGVNIGSVGKVGFQLDYYGNGKGILNKLSDGLKSTGSGIVGFFSEMGKNTGKAFDENIQKTSSYLGTKSGGAGYKPYSSSDIAKALSGLGGSGGSSSGGSGAKKSKEETEALKKSVDRVKDSYTILKNELDKVRTTSEKAAIAEKKWAETIKDAHAAVEQQLKKVRTEYEKTIDTINKDSSKSTTDAVGSQYRSLLEEQKKLEKDIKDEEIKLHNEGVAGGYGGAIYSIDPQKIKDLESVKAQLEEIKHATNIDGTSLLSQNTRAREDQRSTLDEKGKSRFDFQEKLGDIELEKANKISAATDEFAAKRALALKNENIIKTFENQKNARGIKLDNLKKQLDTQNQEKEQQDLIQKLYDERVSLQKAEDEKKAVETRVFRHATDLSTAYHTAEMGMIKERKAEYDTLIEKIQAAIAMAQALQRAQSAVGIASTTKSLPGKSDGGYTGDGGKFEPMAVVHGGEYVLSQEMLANVKTQMPSFLPAMENIRKGQLGKLSGGNQTNNNQKSINLTAPIYVERPIDLHREFSKMMWRGF